MSKRDRDLKRVEEIKDRLRRATTEELIERYISGYLSKAGAVAIREVLGERGEVHLIKNQA